MYSLIVHGGAGTIPPARYRRMIPGLLAALDAGYRILARGGRSLDAAEAAVATLEDDPLFNAGTGSVPTLDGDIEMDASIMHGPTLAAGAVAAVRDIRHPITLTRAVMEQTDHALLAGDGALRFARAIGLPPHDPLTPDRRELWARERTRFDAGRQGRFVANARVAKLRGYFPGTVGAVALDRRGEVVAATSTGGLLLKLEGRVGDSAIIGAGTYASEAGGASATGTGEGILRVLLAKSAIDLVALGHAADAAAAAAVRLMDRVGMTAGLILLDRAGRPGIACNTRNLVAAHRREGEPAATVFPGGRSRRPAKRPLA